MAIRKQPRTRKASRKITLGLDEALIALFVGAMNANEHVAADEASRAQHLMATTRRFRRKAC